MYGENPFLPVNNKLFLPSCQSPIWIFSKYCYKTRYFSRPGEIEHDYRGLLRVPYPALHSDGIVSADPEHSDPDMTGLGLSKTSFTDR